MKLKTIALSTLLTANLFALTVGETIPHATIAGEDGGLVKDAKPFDTNMLQGKLHAVFYVDPDEKDTNEHYFKALKAFKKEHHLDFQSVAVINLGATWKPNFIIEKILQSKQKEFPDTLYVKDKHKLLVKAWGIDDDASDVIILDKNGKVLFYKAGAMSDADAQKSFQIIKDNI